MAAIDALLIALKERSGSDLHLAAGTPPRLRVKGNLDPIEGQGPLDDARLRALLREIVSVEQWADYESGGDLDFAYGLPGVARFRANYLVQQNGAGAVFRIIPEQILTVGELGLPPLAVLAGARFALVERALRPAPDVLAEAAVDLVLGAEALRHAWHS